MKSTNIGKWTSLLAVALAVGAQAHELHESDLTSSISTFDFWTMGPDTNLRPSKIETTPGSEFGIEVVRGWKDGTIATPGLRLELSSGHSVQIGRDGSFRSPAFCSGTVEATIKFETAHFTIGTQSWGSGNNYNLKFNLPCNGTTRVFAEKASPLANVLSIWTVGYKAQEKLRESVGLDFWNSNVAFNYPADGAYYTGGVVNIPNGEEWDVVGHELGHAIFDLANLGHMAGGQHYIDRCYSGTLALSEGWASYFSAFVSVMLDDADAKFEFMVPRRAPIRFENIPADVCNGYTNEWRVTGFLWDVIDLNHDKEALSEQFASAWNLTVGKMARSLEDMKNSLIQGGMNREEIEKAWALSSSGAPTPASFDFESPRYIPGFQSFDDFLRGN